MEEIKQQISKLINKSNNILVATPENINGDILGSALALINALKKIGKNAKLIIPEEIPTKFAFLQINNSFSYENLKEREFILSINNPKDHINKLFYEKKDERLHIYLGAKEKIEEKDLKIIRSHPFDLIFTISSQDFECLGRAFEYNPELFFEIPLINIDNHIENEYFGEINLVDITSSSVSEIIMELIDFLDRSLLDQDIATLILTGLIDATDNFQSSKTMPRTFNNAALLVNRGGDQQKIVRYLYKTKSFDFLRLWGKVLQQLSWDKEKKLIWGKITQKDFQESNTGPECLPQIFEEMERVFYEMKTAFLIWQTSLGEKTEGLVYSLDPRFLRDLAPKLGGVIKNNNLLFFEMKIPLLEEAEKEVLNLMNKIF